MPLSLALLCALGVAAAVADIYPAGIPNVWGGLASAPPGGVLGGCSGQLFGYSGLDGHCPLITARSSLSDQASPPSQLTSPACLKQSRTHSGSAD